MSDPQRVLVFDADDTLWETNLHFNRTFTGFIEWLGDRQVPSDHVRDIFVRVEEDNVRRFGYGTAVFVRNLHDTLLQVIGRPATVEEQSRVDELAADLLLHRADPMPEAAATLAELGGRNRMIMLTKGVESEQRAKIDTSGLAHHFEHVLVVPEKDVGTYQSLVADHGLVPASTWMIGNSPMSDINPARAAGLNAVLIPNEHTWALERAEVDTNDERILHLATFGQLTAHF